jgi:hypothetical protein
MRALLLLGGLLLCGCTRARPFTDDFNRVALGDAWQNSGAPWKIVDGQLTVARAHNHPLWLQRPLPDDVRISFDCVSHSPDGDLKVELFGDGQAHATDDEVARDLQYTASGYVAIFGGWMNSRSVLVKQREHQWQFEHGVPMRIGRGQVVPGQRYHFTFERRGTRLTWFLDGAPFLTLDDPQPLHGPGHDRFGFTGWESDVAFDNLEISPL